MMSSNRPGSPLTRHLTTAPQALSRRPSDAANRPASLQGSLAGVSTNYIGVPSNPTIQYWPHGAIYAYLRGNGLEHAESYNGRLQLTESYESLGNANNVSGMLFISCPNWGLNSNLNVFDLCPHSALTNDNGNLQSYDEYLGGPQASQYQHFAQTFGYDHLNRLTSAADSDWS